MYEATILSSLKLQLQKEGTSLMYDHAAPLGRSGII